MPRRDRFPFALFVLAILTVITAVLLGQACTVIGGV